MTPKPSAATSAGRAKLRTAARRAADRGRRRHAERGRLAGAGRGRVRARARARRDPDAWSEAAVAWEQLERPPLAAYCRWRQAEALVPPPAADAAVPLREAYAVAARIGARPLLRELELLAERAQLELVHS